MKKILLSFLLFAFACSPAPKEQIIKNPGFSLALNIGKKLEKDELKAELGIYQESLNDDKKVLKFLGPLKTLELKQDKDDKLSVTIDETLPFGVYLFRIYLSHRASKNLIWVGEWKISEHKFAETSFPKKAKVINDDESAKGELEGDEHPKIKDAKEQKSSAFGSAGTKNIDKICDAETKTCTDGEIKTCNSNGFGFSTKKCEIENAKSYKCNEKNECQVDSCNTDYQKQENKCVATKKITSCGPQKINCETQKSKNTIASCDGAKCDYECDQANKYYPDPDYKNCLKSPAACSVNDANALTTEKLWDSSAKKFGECKIKTCKQGNHPNSSKSKCEKDDNIKSCGVSAKDCSDKKINPIPDNSIATCDGSKCGYTCDTKKSFYPESGKCLISPRLCAHADLNFKNAEKTWDAGSKKFSGCILKSCKNGYHVESQSCVANTKTCKTSNGEGSQTWDANSKAWSKCVESKCNKDFHLESGECKSNKKVCLFANGNGEQEWVESKKTWGPCTITSCYKGFHEESGKCLSNTKPCFIKDGIAEQKWTASAWGECIIKTCAKGFHVENKKCLSDTRTCKTSNGEGSQVWDSSADAWAKCMESKCNSGFHLESGSCKASTKSCTISNGNGEDSWSVDDKKWQGCKAVKCNTNFHIENDLCLANKQSCTVSNGTGEKEWDNATFTYKACTVKSCSSDYHKEGNSCISNTKECSITNGKGTQSWNVTSKDWDDCLAKSCNKNYKADGLNCSWIESCADNRCLIPGGSFMMGSPSNETGRSSNETQHEVIITYNFFMDQHEVTQKQWGNAFASSKPSKFRSCGDDCPVERVSYWDALNYANERSKVENLEECYDLSGCSGFMADDTDPSTFNCGANSTVILPKKDFNQDGSKNAQDYFRCKGYRLPTEAEWEYAARGGKGTAFFNGNLTKTGRDPGDKDSNLDKIGWYGANSETLNGIDCSAWYMSTTKCGTHEVKQKQKNSYGLFDMSGNVAEWIFESFAAYPSGEVEDPTGGSGATNRVIRGGSWRDEAEENRSAYRIGVDPVASDAVGLRLVRTSFGSCEDGLCLIPKGSFKMGSPKNELGQGSDETQVDVKLSYSFYLGQAEVTQGEWKEIFGSSHNPSKFSSCGDDCPVEQVSFWDALNYANERSEEEGFALCYDLSACKGTIANGSNKSSFGCGSNTTKILPSRDFDGNGVIEAKDIIHCSGYRLPTEAEWEYAARGGSEKAFFNGEITLDTGNDPVLNFSGRYDKNSSNKTHEVKGLIKNEFGLYDIHGNVAEWVFDFYGNYGNDPKFEPFGPDSGVARVYRGGSFSSAAKFSRSAQRLSKAPDLQTEDLGFRIARTFIVESPEIAHMSPIYPASPSTQIKCYNNNAEISCPKEGEDFYGQDGNYVLEGSFSRFKGLKDGTIYDRVLNSFWAKCESGKTFGSGGGFGCGTAASVTKNWNNAKTNCENKKIADLDNWRLPGVQELGGLYDVSIHKFPYIDSIFMKNGDSHWAFTSWAGNMNSGSNNASYVNFKEGTINPVINKTNKYKIRCISSGPKPLYEKQALEDLNNGIIIEKTSGLRFSKCPIGKTGSDCKDGAGILKMNWKNALKSCEELELGGRTWRLPNRFEMAFFIDYTNSSLAVFNTSALSFLNYDLNMSNSSNLYWTSSTRSQNPEYAWLASLTEGKISYFNKNKAEKLATICVSSPKISDYENPRPIKIAAANESQCRTCTDWTDCETCSDTSTCPKRTKVAFGQEASIPISVPLRFKDLENETLLDLNTGRQWTKCAAGAKGNDCSEEAASTKNFNDAKSYCDRLNLAGHTDWRLPHIKELLLIQDFSLKTNPAIDKKVFTNFPDGTSIWSGTEQKYYPGKVHSVSYTSDSPSSKANSLITICTRGPKISNNFKDNSDGTINDLSTGIMWQKCNSGQLAADANCAKDSNGTSNLNWKDALAYCQKLEVAGYKDWQLPTIRELQTVIDYQNKTSSGAYINPIFKGALAFWYWSRTPTAAKSNQVWAISLAHGKAYSRELDFVKRVQCVRYSQ